MNNDAWSSKLWWSIPAGTILLLLLLAKVFGGVEQPKKAGTSYDASTYGFRASYLLLDELGYPVTRSKRPTSDGARFVLISDVSTAPTAPMNLHPRGAASSPSRDEARQKEAAELLDAWIKQGGVVVLADAVGAFAEQLGLDVDYSHWNEQDEPTAGVAGVKNIAGGKQRVAWKGQTGRVWAQTGSHPLVTVHERGRGEIWLIHRPELLNNKWLGEADNGILLCRLADAVLARTSGKLAFDEYCHGMRDRPSVTTLLFEPPMLWVTLQGLLLLGLLLWRFAPRFGTLQPSPPPTRRSKEEFLEALATLLERKGDYDEAVRTVRADLVRAIEQELGLPAGTTIEEVIEEAARRRPVQRERLTDVLSARTQASRHSKTAFLPTLHDLETARHEFFDRRNH